MNFDKNMQKKVARLVGVAAIVVFAIMYGIGHHFSSGTWDVPSPKPQGIVATADYGFQKLFFGDKYSNGEYIEGTSVISGMPSSNPPPISNAGNSSELTDNSVAASAPTPAPSTSDNSVPSEAAASSSMIAENAKFGQIGQCKLTSVAKVSTRLDDTPGSGSAINYADGTFGVSYDTVPGVDDSQPGDQIKLCLVSIPSSCPAGEDDGSVYSAENLRTKQSWSLPNSSHECGGA